MTLQEVFETLLHGELSELSVAESSVDNLSEKDQARLVSHINLGLTALHTRFPIKEGRVLVQLDPDRREYPLQSKFALHNEDSEEIERFLMDTAENPFRDDILKIERILTDTDFECSVNDLNDPLAIATPTASRLVVPSVILRQDPQLPDPLITATLEVVYRAKHRKIDVQAGDYDAYTVEVDLPEVFLHPLALFVGMRMHTPLGVGQGEGLSSQAYAARYEQACREITNYGAQVDKLSQNNQLREKGFV